MSVVVVVAETQQVVGVVTPDTDETKLATISTDSRDSIQNRDGARQQSNVSLVHTVGISKPRQVSKVFPIAFHITPKRHKLTKMEALLTDLPL